MFDVAEPDKPAALTPAAILAEAVADTGGDPAAAPGAAPAAPAAPVDPQKEAEELIDFARSLFAPLYPSLEKVYTPDVCAKLATAGAPVLHKYGLTLGALFGRWGAEFGFAIVAVPLVAPTIAAIRADRAARPADNAAVATPAGEQKPPEPPAPPNPLAAFPGQAGEGG